MRVAVLQMRSTVSIADNIAAFDAGVREAAKEGAVYIQTPEMSGILEKNRKALFSEIKTQEQDELVKHAALLSRELGIWLHIGSHAILVGEQKAANRAFIFSPRGELITTYDKIHMFDVDLEDGGRWRESNVYEPGRSSKIVQVADARLGISICYDMRFPSLYRQQAVAGAEILTAPSSFTRQTGKAHWHVLLRSRAIENGAFMVAAAQGGVHDDGRETFGHSLIINPWGEIIAEVAGNEPGFAIADLDLGAVEAARSCIPNLANQREFVLETIDAKMDVPA